MSTIGWFILCATIAPGVSWWRAGHRGIGALFALLNGPGFALLSLAGHLPRGGLIITVVTVALQLVFLIQSALGAWAVRRATRREPWQTTLIFFGAVLVAAIPSRIVQSRQVESYRIEANSMAPSLITGDQVMVVNSQLERGAVIVFTPPGNEFRYAKRVIGVAGDVVAIHEGRLSINGTQLARTPCDEPSAGCELEAFGGRRWRVISPPNPAGDGEWTVPGGQLFVLGDNRANSSDSRSFGTVPVNDVDGVARDIHFSWPEFSRTFQSIDPE